MFYNSHLWAFGTRGKVRSAKTTVSGNSDGDQQTRLVGVTGDRGHDWTHAGPSNGALRYKKFGISQISHCEVKVSYAPRTFEQYTRARVPAHGRVKRVKRAAPKRGQHFSSFCFLFVKLSKSGKRESKGSLS